MESFANLLARHANTIFIGAHGSCYAKNLAWANARFDRCLNFYMDISARIGELGRQPNTAGALLSNMQNTYCLVLILDQI